MKNRSEEIIQAIIKNTENIIKNTRSITEIKTHLAKHGILGGQVEKVLSNPAVLKEEDDRETALFVEQFFVKTGNSALNPENWFTEIEMKVARQYDKMIFTKQLDTSPFVFENVSIVGRGVYSTEIDIPTLSRLMDMQIPYYDFDIQRQPTKRKGSVTPRATVYKKNVKEIKELLLKNQLAVTTLSFNATIGSSDTEEEVYFDSQARTLTLNGGTKLAILDGYHRYLGSLEAYSKNPDLDFTFMLRLSNVSKRECQIFQSQIAKATPIPKTRMQMLEAERLADTVTQVLMADSELKDKVAAQRQVTTSAGELVSYNVLTDAIEREFPMEFRRDTDKVAKYLGKFFDELIAEYSEEFLRNKNEDRSLINYNKMFAGYVALAARMQKEDVELDKLKSILDRIDFSRDNPIWEEIGFLNSNKNVIGKMDEREIANYFKRIEL